MTFVYISLVLPPSAHAHGKSDPQFSPRALGDNCVPKSRSSKTSTRMCPFWMMLIKILLNGFGDTANLSVSQNVEAFRKASEDALCNAFLLGRKNNRAHRTGKAERRILPSSISRRSLKNIKLPHRGKLINVHPFRFPSWLIPQRTSIIAEVFVRESHTCHHEVPVDIVFWRCNPPSLTGG